MNWLFSVINNLGMPSSELQTNFGVLQIDTENSATGALDQLQCVGALNVHKRLNAVKVAGLSIFHCIDLNTINNCPSFDTWPKLMSISVNLTGYIFSFISGVFLLISLTLFNVVR